MFCFTIEGAISRDYNITVEFNSRDCDWKETAEKHESSFIFVLSKPPARIECFRFWPRKNSLLLKRLIAKYTVVWLNRRSN